MGWRTDWLYRIVFDFIRDVWRRANREAEIALEQGELKAMPQPFLVQQCAKVNLLLPGCAEPVLREWFYGGTEFHEQRLEVVQAEESQGRLRRRPNLPPAILGMFFEQGLVRFYIFPNRKRVVITYLLGPLYGRGFVYEVKGQGRTATLQVASDTPGWIS